MGYTATKLLSESFYMSGIVAREFQTIQGAQLQEGLETLNTILSDKTVEDGMLPYYSTYQLAALEGVEKYFIPNLISISSIVFYLNTVRYEMKPIPRHEYFGTTRPENVKSLPFTYHVERAVGGCNLYIYYFPNQTYLLKIFGLFTLQITNINQDLQAKNNTLSLGNLIYTGTTSNIVLSPLQFVINNYDLAGVYLDINALLTVINTANTTGVNALLRVNNFILLSEDAIHLTTNGIALSPNTITFQDFGITDLEMLDNTYLVAQFDLFYINYLICAVAVRLCIRYAIDIPKGLNDLLLKYEGWIDKTTQQLDLRNVKISTLSSDDTLNYASIRFGRGWSPTS